MAEEDVKEEESDVFEIDDFTAASEWERFIYRIEEIIGPHGWKLDNSCKKRITELEQLKTQDDKQSPVNDEVGSPLCSLNPLSNREPIEWKLQSETLKFANFLFTLSHHKLKQPKVAMSCESGFEGLPQALIDSFDMSYDFPPRAHCLSRWYGVKEFLILYPSSKEDSIDTESRTNLLWSSVGVALSNLKCQLPMFIQISNWRRLLHYGMCVGNGFRTSYEMIHLQYTPSECNHVQGMIETFKAKIGCPVPSPIQVKIRFTYRINDWPPEARCPHTLEGESRKIEENFSLSKVLPFGPLSDPIKDFQLAVCWPSVSSDMLNDDSNFSDLDPELAPQWWLKARCSDESVVCLHEHVKGLVRLSQKGNDSIPQIIRALSADNISDTEGLSNDVSHVLDRLVEPVPSLTSPLQTVVSNAARSVVKTSFSDSPIPDPLLQEALEYLFPDANMTKEEALIIQSKLADEQKSIECDATRSRDIYRHLKSAPVDSLTYKTAITLCVMNYEYGVQGVAHFWHEFVLEMRYRFENNIIIPRLAESIPNLNYCLLHQKLQMLNYCIKRRQQRANECNSKDKFDDFSSDFSTSKEAVSYRDYEKNSSSSKDENGAEAVISSFINRDKSWSDLLANIEKGPVDDQFNADSVSYSDRKSSSPEDSEDEFFEVDEEMQSSLFSDCKRTDEICKIAEDDKKALEVAAEGVLEVTELKLLREDKQLCIPLTQESPPLTEDMLLEQQEIMTKLGTSEEAAKVRVQMQSASLMSDMEAFKAANPGCILEDFVRWYSPNDWLPGPESEEERMELNRYMTERRKDVEKESSEGWEFELDEELNNHLIDTLVANEEFAEDGHLSLRMRVPGNVWGEMWAAARAVPVRRQKRLFDDTKEAEKVLHFLSNLRPSELALNTFPVVIHASVIRLRKEEDSVKIPSLLEHIVSETSRIYSPSLEHLKVMEIISKSILKAEIILARMHSLRLKFYENSHTASKKEDEEIECLIDNLLSSSEVFVKNGGKSKVGKIISALLIHANNQNPNQPNELLTRTKFPIASGREYILRSMVPRPNVNSRYCPQRLYTVITPDEFRMAGSFTQDTNFI